MYYQGINIQDGAGGKKEKKKKKKRKKKGNTFFLFVELKKVEKDSAKCTQLQDEFEEQVLLIIPIGGRGKKKKKILRNP